MTKMTDPYETNQRFLAFAHYLDRGLGTAESGSFLEARHLAENIVKDPQAHIDALVEAGVLRVEDWQSVTGGGDSYPHYAVVQPHVHEWRVDRTTALGASVYLVCDCGAREAAPNRLPIEAPE